MENCLETAVLKMQVGRTALQDYSDSLDHRRNCNFKCSTSRGDREGVKQGD
jgi:hypothetical protein